VESSAGSFIHYLNINVDERTIDILHQIAKKSTVYIFSGVIRNFFLGLKDVRDVDIVLSGEVDIESYFYDYNIRRNSFGGYKLSKEGISLDIWILGKSWAFQNQKILDFEIDKYMPSTAFFNFSSILFNLNESRFFYTKHFLRFIRDKKIDVVYKPNANYELCTINSFYYSDKYGLKLSENLKMHLFYLHKTNLINYENVQLKHFGKVLYSNSTIQNRIDSLKEERAEKINLKSSVFIEYKKYVNQKPLNAIKKTFVSNGIGLSLQRDEELYYNFTGPEWADIIVYIKDNIILAPAVYDLFKTAFLHLINSFQHSSIKSATKISIKYEDDRQRSVELNIEGNFGKEESVSIVEGAMRIITSDEKENIFDNPKFVDEMNSRILFEYNKETKKWEPFDFAKARQEWDDLSREIENLNS